MINILKEISENIGIEASDVDGHCWSVLVPLIFKLQSEGASLLIKSDGERSSNIFTVMIEGGMLGEDYLRCETDNLSEGVSQLISGYAKECW